MTNEPKSTAPVAGKRLRKNLRPENMAEINKIEEDLKSAMAAKLGFGDGAALVRHLSTTKPTKGKR